MYFTPFHREMSVSQEAQAAELIARWKQKAEAAKAELLSLDLQALRNYDEVAFVHFLWEVYKRTALFPDSAVQDKFTSVGLIPLHQRWFVDLNDILAAIHEITADGDVFLLKFDVLKLTKLHIDTKIATDIQYWRGMVVQRKDGSHTTKLKMAVLNHYRRRRYGGGGAARSKDAYDAAMNEIIEGFEKQIGDPKIARRLALSQSEGNTKKTILTGIVESCQHELRPDAFYRRFFPLFRLICRDISLLSEVEFNRQPRYLGRSYKSYQTKRVKDIIDKDHWESQKKR